MTAKMKEKAEKVAVEFVELGRIKIPEHLETRANLRTEAIEEYADLLTEVGSKNADGEERWPFVTPVDVFYDGDIYWLADGRHRHAAAEKVGKSSIKCSIRQGTAEDAIAYGVGANQSHGVRRSNEDKRMCVLTVLRQEKRCNRRPRADRTIAKLVGVSHPFVARMREEFNASTRTDSSGNISTRREPEERETASGKVITVAPKAEPRRDGSEFQRIEVIANGLDDIGDAGDSLPASSTSPSTWAMELPVRSTKVDIDGLAAPYKRAINDITRIVRELNAVASEERSGAHLNISIQRIRTDLQAAKDAIRMAEPVETCLRCEGNGCNRCLETGFLTRMLKSELSNDVA